MIDLAANPPRVVNHVTVGDAPEGITIRPNGDLAAITLLNGSYDNPNAAWYRREAGRVRLLKIDGNNVTPLNGMDVGSFPEGVAFSKSGTYLYAGNFHSNSVSILRVGPEGVLADTGKTIELPGPPGSLRIGSR